MIMVMEHRDNRQEQQQKMIIYLYIQMTRRPKENHGHSGKMGGHLSQKMPRDRSRSNYFTTILPWSILSLLYWDYSLP